MKQLGYDWCGSPRFFLPRWVVVGAVLGAHVGAGPSLLYDAAAKGLVEEQADFRHSHDLTIIISRVKVVPSRHTNSISLVFSCRGRQQRCPSTHAPQYFGMKLRLRQPL